MKKELTDRDIYKLGYANVKGEMDFMQGSFERLVRTFEMYWHEVKYGASSDVSSAVTEIERSIVGCENELKDLKNEVAKLRFDVELVQLETAKVQPERESEWIEA